MNEIVKGSIDLIRQLNYGLVYASLEEHKELSRTDLSRLTGLSPASITKITRERLDGGLVVTCGESSVGRGRRQTLLRINERRFQFLSMRLGRGYVDMALFDLAGRSLARHRHTFSEAERADLLASLVRAIEGFLPKKALRLACIALCLPGQVERHSGMVKHFPFYDLRNWPLGPTLQQAFAVPVLVSGDVRTWIQAEREWGAAKNCADAVLVFVHNDIGVGMVVNGQLIESESALLGDLSHLQLEPYGQRCYCGGFGCACTLVTNQALEAQYRDLRERMQEYDLPESVTIRELCELALAGNSLCQDILHQAAGRLSRVLSNLICLLNPGKLLLGGEITRADRLLFPMLHQSLASQLPAEYLVRLQIESTHFYEDPTKPTSVQVHKALRDGSLLLDLQGRFLLMLCLVSLLQLVLLSGASYYYVSEQRYQEVGDQALDVARLVAREPGVIAGVKRGDTARLNVLVERIRAEVGASYIVIGDSKARRLVHPNADRIGQPMVGDDPARALQGEAYISRAQGSLGVSVRGKGPIRNEMGQVIGVVSVGYLVRDIDADLQDFLRFGLAMTLIIVLLNSAAAAWLARRYKRAILGFEPEQIGRLYAELDCTLRTVREGILTIDEQGRLTSLNPNGIRLLRLDEQAARAAIGQPVTQLLPESRMLSLIQDPRPQYDEEIVLNGQQLIVNRLPLVRDGKLIGAVSSFRRKDELAELSAQLSQVQAYSDLLRVQTHEHNNQLGTIAGMIELGATQEALAFIGREAATEQTLLSFLMGAIAKPKVAGLLLGKYHRAHELGLVLVVDPDSRLHDIPLRVSGSQLVTLLGNLIDNAFEATRRHGAPYQPIRVSLSDLGQDLILEVEDGAGGIDPALADRLFERGVSSKVEPGHGIGLALVRKTLDALQGTITIEATTQGSCVVCYIPKEV